ncbi:MAG: CpaD family pilus assembly protein [Sphingomonadaceae bacterium]|nr:CpaD family pilus assembly protein [Sphingomonadaceae bacterium]MDW8415044.1 CpaD family pilus assembly lipoprotein [Thermaurantiacus sp.]
MRPEPVTGFGAAVAHNLGAMVADPVHLAQPATLGPAEGEPAVKAVERLRRGETPRLPPSAAGGTAAEPGS